MNESPKDGRSLSPIPSANATNPQLKQDEPVQPQKLELILNPEDGSLQTAPLLSVITACTDSLYRDIYDMAHGELQIIGGRTEGETDAGASSAVRKDKMSNLSFAARRHELSYRLASHSKALTHVAALTASNNSDENANLAKFVDVSTKALTHARTAWIQNDECQDALYFFHGRLFSLRAGPHDIYGALDFMVNGNTSNSAINSGNSDAKDTTDGKNVSNGCTSFWYDLPSDLKLETDRYETSIEKQWSKQEVSDRWQMAVRRKLLLGEVGWMTARQRHQNQSQPGTASDGKGTLPMRSINKVPWKISLKGGIVRLMHGKPKRTIDNITNKTKTVYPLEAILTVLTTDSDIDQPNSIKSGDNSVEEDHAEWTLINVDVCAQAKTGQSNHQLDTTNKQRFNLHRLCALAMAREEKQNRLRQQQQKEVVIEEGSQPLPLATVARPLNALFRVAQYFSLSWQLEILSEQAKALSKGNWGGSTSGRDGRGLGSVLGGRRMGGSSAVGSTSIVITPVKFFENRTSRILGVLSISFWAIDDRCGPPAMGDLVRLDEEDDDDENKTSATGIAGSTTNGFAENDSVSTVSRSVQNPAVTNMLTLSVRAEPDVGIKVSLSGADSIMEFATQPNNSHVRSTIGDLLEATSNPFALSASEALLAATILCAERKCYAMVEALPTYLPKWITLTVEKGSIVVAANIQYYISTSTNGDESTGATPISASSEPVVLFRLACDSRSGSFIPTFPRSTPLLQHMACNDVQSASDTTLLRLANLAKLRQSRNSTKAVSAGAVFGSGRVVRDAFESLSRSMNVLGQRTGVGGAWKDHNEQSTRLRRRNIGQACDDVKVSLMSCCGMAVLYGLSAVSMGVATGIQASPEMAGGKSTREELSKAAAKLSFDTKTMSSFLLSPPPSLLIDQKIIEHASWTPDGERVKKSLAEQERFGVCCSVDEVGGLILYGAEIKTEIESPSSIPTRKEFELVAFASGNNQKSANDPAAPPTKRAKLEASDINRQIKTRDLMEEVEHFAAIFAETLGM